MPLCRHKPYDVTFFLLRNMTFPFLDFVKPCYSNFSRASLTQVSSWRFQPALGSPTALSEHISFAPKLLSWSILWTYGCCPERTWCIWSHGSHLPTSEIHRLISFPAPSQECTNYRSRTTYCSFLKRSLKDLFRRQPLGIMGPISKK